MTSYLRYSQDVERLQPDEQDTVDRIIAVMTKGSDLTRKKYGRFVRTTHTKAHGLLKGELRVKDALPIHLRQGLFAEARTYPVIIRLSHVPGEFLDDRYVSGPRGMALKILDVAGPKLPAHEAEQTQDFVLDTGRVFTAAEGKAFLAQITPLQTVAPRLSDTVKEAISAVARAGNTALEAVGVTSPKVDLLGHPFRHPLAEPFYSQAPIRYGDYVAKLRVAPLTPELTAMAEGTFEPRDENGLRGAVVEYFRTRGAEFEVAIQLCTDLERMPVEDAHTEWPEDESPYQPVATLVIAAQSAFSEARQTFVEEDLSFCPAHSLVAHQPLGSIMRARMQAYEALSRLRREANGRPAREPRSIDEMPD